MRRSAALTVVLAVAAGTSCVRRAKAPAAPEAVVTEVQITDNTPEADRPAALDVAAVRAEAERLLRDSRAFSVQPGRALRPGEQAWRMRIEVGLGESVRDGRGLARAVLWVRLEPLLGSLDATRLDSQGGAERAYALETADLGQVYTDLVKRALADVMRGVLTHARLRRAEPGDLIAALADAEPETRLAAVLAAAERRERRVVPALVERLADPVDVVRDRALGALVEIGDRRAVRPLTEQTKFRDHEGMRKVVDAIASLGGDEARAYLEFVAAGHEDREIRELAREALERMARKAGAAPHR
jgi:HEAT repeat protein